MRLHYKITLMIVIFSTLLFGSFIVIHSALSDEESISSERIKLLENAKIFSERIELNLIDKISITKSFVVAPIVTQALKESNDMYASLTKDKQNQKIDQLNQKWKQSKDKDNPFVNSYLTNPLSVYLKMQQHVLPGVYGEIFITNRYGAMISTTKKLSTLAHAHKYWWKESYNEDKVFIDDRGFDISVMGYVIGIVVPIKKDGEIIGIIKSNINIITTLNKTIKSYSALNSGDLIIARSKGAIVLENGVTPLSTRVNHKVLNKFHSMEAGHSIIEDDGIEKLIATAPVRLTLDNDNVKFGGKPLVKGSSYGNDKEIWYTLITEDKSAALSKHEEISKLLLYVAITIVLFTLLLYSVISKFISHPLEGLTNKIQNVDRENLDIDVDVEVNSKDEIGTLSKTFKKILFKLNKTTASRDKLLEEIGKRKKIENELVEAKKMAEEANTAKSLFLSNMSHEVRTPLNGIIGLTQLTLDTKLTTKQKYYLSKVQSSSKSLLHIINDILDYSKMQAGKLHMNFEPFKILDILDTISGVFGFEVSKKDIELLFHIDKDIPETLIGDQLRLTQILINLIGNSIKFTEHGEVVLCISVKHIADSSCELEFSVKDTGIGIKKEDQDKLFKKFSQVDNSYKRKYEGTGLGLVITKEFISMMGGEISCSSVYGEGSDFSFNLKLNIYEGQTHNNTSIKSIIKGERVLVIYSKETSGVIIDEILRSWNLDTTLSHNGKDAIKKIEESFEDGLPYDYILLDWKISELSAIELLKKIKNIHIKNDITIDSVLIIMITEYAKDEFLAKIKKHKVNPKSILFKPITASTLLTAMVGEIKKSQLHEKVISYDNNMEPIAGAEVLLVEDNDINTLVAKEYLRNMHLNVTTVINGLEAVNKVKNHEFDIIFMDLQMPIMDGIEATKEIKNIDDKKSIPIIAMTAAAMKKDREYSKDAGMQGHIAKPIDIDELKNVLLKFIEPDVENRRIRADITKESTKDNNTLPNYIDGVNINDLQIKLAGDTHLISKLLLNFANKYDALEDQFSEKKVESENFKALIHSIKGESGNMSITNVYNLAVKIYDSDSIDEQKKLVKLLHERLIEVIYNIREKIEIKDEKSKFRLTQNEMIEIIDEYIEKLDKHYFINIDEIDKLLAGLIDYAREDVVSVLSDSFNELDYIVAHDTLQEIKQNIEKRI